jgi:hypothetical protein
VKPGDLVQSGYNAYGVIIRWLDYGDVHPEGYRLAEIFWQCGTIQKCYEDAVEVISEAS